MFERCFEGCLYVDLGGFAFVGGLEFCLIVLVSLLIRYDLFLFCVL